MLFDAGFAGIVVPKEYGGAGLTPAHAKVFSEEISGFDYPSMLGVPNFTPCMAVILEFGTHEQKLRHIPPILKGEHVFVQFLSEPSSASDAAGARTTAIRDGDEWVLNGSKIWSSGAWRADYGLCLARTNWDVEKHRGLSVFLVPVHAPGVELHRIEMLEARRSSARSSSPTSASPTPIASATSTTAGRSVSAGSITSGASPSRRT